MGDRTWHSGPPPHIGWWNASVGLAFDSWRWWDGKHWSQAVFPEDCAVTAAVAARIPYINRHLTIEWTDYWPEGARVPRIDPRKQQ